MVISKRDAVEDIYRQSSDSVVAEIIQFTCNSIKLSLANIVDLATLSLCSA
jgi:hypothetical protein